MKSIYLILALVVMASFQNCGPASAAFTADTSALATVGGFICIMPTPDPVNRLVHDFGEVRSVEYRHSGGYPSPVMECPPNLNCPHVATQNPNRVIIKLEHESRVLRVFKMSDEHVLLETSEGTDAYLALQSAIESASWLISQTPDFIADAGDIDLTLNLSSGATESFRFPMSEHQYQRRVLHNEAPLQDLLQGILRGSSYTN